MSSVKPNLNEIDFRKLCVVLRLLDIEDGDDILVLKVAQQLHLP